MGIIPGFFQRFLLGFLHYILQQFFNRFLLGFLQQVNLGIRSLGISPGFLQRFLRHPPRHSFWGFVRNSFCDSFTDSSRDSCREFFRDSLIDIFRTSSRTAPGIPSMIPHGFTFGILSRKISNTLIGVSSAIALKISLELFRDFLWASFRDSFNNSSQDSYIEFC